MSDNYRELDSIEVDGTPVKFNAANVLANIDELFVVDDTLSIPGAMADAKKTGDEIGELKEDLSDLELRVEVLEKGGGGETWTNADEVNY